MGSNTVNTTFEPPRLSADATAIGEVLAVLEAHAHRLGLVGYTRRAFAQTLPHAVAELEAAERRVRGRERIATVLSRDSEMLAPYARLKVEIIDLDPLA